jgi:hypothetical protein
VAARRATVETNLRGEEVKVLNFGRADATIVLEEYWNCLT